MKKKIIFGAALVLLLTGCSFASDIQQDIANNNSKGFISVNTETKEELSPTSVQISFAIQNQAKDPQEAATLNKETSTKVIEAVKGLVNTSKGETIKTTSYYLNPEYNYRDGTRRLTGYMASNTLQVKLKDIDKAGKVITTALSNGATSVNNLDFALEETGENCNKLIAQAAKNAKARASKIAEAMGTNISGIKSVNANCSSNQSYASNFVMRKAYNSEAAVADSMSGGEAPIEAGKTMLRAYVNAEFFVK